MVVVVDVDRRVPHAKGRIAAGKPKVDQIKNTGARVVVAACENCRLQIGDLNEHYNLNVRVSALTDLVIRAMKLPKPLPGTEAEQLFEGEKAAVTE